MALQAPFFGKREADALHVRHLPSSGSASSAASASGSSASTSASMRPASSTASTASPVPTDTDDTSATRATGAGEGSESKLTVGPNIKLKGVEITDCDTLLVEGTVEATMDSRVIQISERGAFKGSAEIDIAEIHGEFSGNLTARQRLVIYSTGKVTGKIRYGKVVIEEGGQLAGEIEAGMPVKPASAVVAARQVAAG